MKKKKNLVMTISMIVLTLIIIAGSTYAFFELTINNDNAARADIIAKNLKLEFTDGPKVELTDVLPGATIIKTFSVENTGTETLYYTIYLNDVINTFTRNSDLVYTITSTNDGAVIGETELPKTSKALYQNIEIPVNTTQDYTLTITYKNLNEDQNADMGKMFSGTIQLVAGVKTYNLTGYAYDNNGDLMNSGTVEVHSDVITAPIQSNGSFTLVNVPVGDHEIIIKNANQVVVAEDTFKLEESNNTSISGNSIKATPTDKTLTITLNGKASDDIDIQVLGNINTVDLTVNNGYTTSPVLTAYSGQKTNVVTISPEEHYHFKNITCDNDIEYTLDNNKLYVNKLTTSGTCTINYEIDTVNVQLVVNNGTGADSKTIAYNTSTTFTSAPNTGYIYESISCTNGMNASYSGTTVTTGTIINNTVCTLTYASPINLYNMMANNALNTTINFSVNSRTSGTHGIYTTTATEGSVPVYYYRGDADKVNNNVIFNNMCWKIIRTTETGGVKLIYNGTPTNGECIRTYSATEIGTSKFNTSYNDNAYVGYMYGTTGSSTYAATHANINDSTIKTYIDTWFSTNFNATTIAKLEDTVFCNDRSTVAGGNNNTRDNSYGTLGYGKNTTGYGALARSSMYTITPNPSLVCPNNNDKFTVSNTKGNGALTYPVGLITLDEVVLAGYNTKESNSSDYKNTTNYLHTGRDYWTFSSVYMYTYGGASVGDVTGAGETYNNYVNLTTGVRPVVSLASGTLAAPGGEGTTSNPYVVN